MEGPSPAPMVFFLAPVAVGLSRSVVAAVCLCFVCFFSCPPFCFLRLRGSSSPPYLAWCCLLCASSRRGVRGGFSLCFCVLLKRVCGQPRAGCLACLSLLSVVCRPCLVFCVLQAYLCAWWRVCTCLCALRLCDVGIVFRNFISCLLPSALAYTTTLPPPSSSSGPSFL